MWRETGFALTMAAGLAGCVSTSELPLAPNQVRLDTHATGAMWVGKAGDATLRRAAEVTIAHGFTRFRLEQPQTGQGAQLAGLSTGYGWSTPVYASTADMSVTVLMFHDGEPGSQNTFEATKILAQQ